MRIEDLTVERIGDDVKRSVRIAWIAGETRLWVRTPAALTAPGDEVSPFVPVALQLAMRRAEPLQIDGPVSEKLLENTAEAQTVLSAWSPTLTRIRVRARELAPAASPAAGRACCFSRGVDSLWSATMPRRPGDEITHLVYMDGYDPVYTERTSSSRIEAARAAAADVGLPLVVASTNVAEVLHHVVDFEDGHGAALAMLGLSLGFGRFVIPSSRSYSHLLPTGSHPLLDYLWSSDRVAIEHDSLQLERIDRVRWLADNRPDMLRHLHVCYGRDSASNCGECGKCTWAMLLLTAAGALDKAPFPGEFDLERVRSLDFPGLVTQLGLSYAHNTIPDLPEFAELRGAVADAMATAARRPMAEDSHAMLHRQTLLFRSVVAGRPFPGIAAGPHDTTAEVAPLDPSWPPPRGLPPGRLGLLAGIDGEARSHVYAVDGVPPGSFIGELGAVLEREPERGRPLVLDSRGRPVPASANGRRPALRWVLAPLRFGGPLPPRVRALGRRALDAGRARALANGAMKAATAGGNGAMPGGRARAATASSRADGGARAGAATASSRADGGERAGAAAASSRAAAPAGWLHAEDGEGRLALWAAPHPVLDDVLLTTDPDEARRLGYRAPELLGWLEALAPMTGTLGVTRPVLAWTDGWRQFPDRATSRS